MKLTIELDCEPNEIRSALIRLIRVTRRVDPDEVVSGDVYATNGPTKHLGSFRVDPS